MDEVRDYEGQDMLVEGEDYELVLPENYESDQAWDVRFLKGDYIETVVRYGNVAVDDTDDTRLNFNFVIQYTPDTILTEDDDGLQEYAGHVLLSIITDAISNDELVTSEKVDDGKD